MSNVFNSGSAEFSNPYSGIIGATDFSTDIYPSINNAIASGGGSTPQPYIGTWIATDFESQTIPSVNNTLQKIDNFQPSTLNQTNINGKLTTTDDITSTKFIVQGGTNIQYLLADGTLLTSSANSGNSNFYLYKSTDNATTPPIGSGNIVYNNANQSLATIVYISHLTRDNVDIEIFFQNVSSLNDLYIQDQNNSLNYIRYNITGTPTIVPNNYVLIPVIINTSGGTGSTSFGTNHNVLLSIFTNSIETDVRISNLETKTQNQTAVLGTTTLSGSLTMSGNTITDLATPILGTDAVNKSYVDNSVVVLDNCASGQVLLPNTPNAIILSPSSFQFNKNTLDSFVRGSFSFDTSTVSTILGCSLPNVVPIGPMPTNNYLYIGLDLSVYVGCIYDITSPTNQRVNFITDNSGATEIIGSSPYTTGDIIRIYTDATTKTAYFSLSGTYNVSFNAQFISVVGEKVVIGFEYDTITSPNTVLVENFSFNFSGTPITTNATNYQWLLTQSTLSNNNNNISIIHNANPSYGITKIYPQPNVLNYFSCILPNISTLPNRNYPENYIYVGFIDSGTLISNSTYVAYLSIFNVAGVASYNIGWADAYDPVDYTFSAGDRVQITINGFTNSITWVISGSNPISKTMPYVLPFSQTTNLRMTVGSSLGSPNGATGNTYTFSKVIFTQSAPISISNVGTGNTLINTSNTPAYTVKSVSVSGTGISTSTSTATDLIISSTALPTTGGTMTGTITTNNATSVVLNGTITGNIYPTTSNTYGVGVSTLPYLSSEINSMNTKNIILHNSGRTFNTTINSANTSSFSLTLPPSQGGVGTFLQNNGSGLLNWVSSGVASPSNVQTFTTVGISTYTPTAGTIRAMVIVQGSGGSGGGAGTANSNNGCGAGGNAGSSYVGYFAIDATKLGTISIGAGGIGIVGTGGGGGFTTFLFPSVGIPNGTITGNGGNGGGFRTSNGGVSGGGGDSSDQYIVSLGASTTGTATAQNSVFLGGYSQTSGLGRHGVMVAPNLGTSGSGGLSLIFGGGGGAARISIANNTNVSGIAGTNGTGSGGSGGIQTGGAFGATGGAGGTGCVIIVEYF